MNSTMICKRRVHDSAGVGGHTGVGAPALRVRLNKSPTKVNTSALETGQALVKAEMQDTEILAVRGERPRNKHLPLFCQCRKSV